MLLRLFRLLLSRLPVLRKDGKHKIPTLLSNDLLDPPRLAIFTKRIFFGLFHASRFTTMWLCPRVYVRSSLYTT